MAELSIKNKELEPVSGFVAEITDQNPATAFDEIPGSNAVGLEFSKNDTNRLILGDPDNLTREGSANDRNYSGAVLKHLGQILMSGIFVLDDTESVYGGWIKDVIGNLGERISGKYINQSDLGGAQVFQNKENYDPDTDDYCCPKIFNPNFYDGKGSNTTVASDFKDIEGNEYQADETMTRLSYKFFVGAGFLVNCPTAGGVKTTSDTENVAVSPFLFLHRAIELLLKDQQMFVTENYLKTHPELKKLFVYSNFDITKVLTGTVEAELPEWDAFSNQYLGLFKQKIDYVHFYTDNFLYRDILPKVKLPELILWIQNKFNLVFSFNDLNEVRIVHRDTLLTAAAHDIDRYASGVWKQEERKNVIIQFKDGKDDTDSAYSSVHQDLSDLRQFIGDPVASYANLPVNPSDDEIRLVLDENKYYQYRWHKVTVRDAEGREDSNDVLDWDFISIGFQDYFYNDGDRETEKIENGFSPLRMSENGFPLVYQKGNSPAFKSQYEKFGPRLMFYTGNETCNHETANLSLEWKGTNGLIEKLWKMFLPFWANRLPVNRTFKLPPSEYYYIRNNKDILPLRTREGSFIIDKMTARVTEKDYIETEIRAYKRENIGQYTEGVVAGGGSGNQDEFVPLFVGVTLAGRPYLVDASGSVRSTWSFGTISDDTFAGNVSIDYSEADNLLFVGGRNGTLYVYDLANNFQYKGIKVFASGSLCGVKIVNGRILIGSAASPDVYEQPYYSDFASYADNQAVKTGVVSGNNSPVRHFCYADGYYYLATDHGQLNRSNNLASAWSEIYDYDAHFTVMAVTETKIWVMDDDDRPFWAARSNPTHWYDFDLEAGDEPCAMEAIPFPGDKLLVITKDEYQGARIVVDPANRDNLLTPPLARFCYGACNYNDHPHISIEEASGATKIAKFQTPGWTYINVPNKFSKLFVY